jgi:hypothetical protein
MAALTAVVQRYERLNSRDQVIIKKYAVDSNLQVKNNTTGEKVLKYFQSCVHI